MNTDASWAVRLGALAKELDPRLPGLDEAGGASSRLPGGKNTRMAKLVCPEVYRGNKFGHPYNQRGFEAEDCHGVPPFKQVLSIILPVRMWDTARVDIVIRSIRDLYDVPLVLAGAHKDVAKWDNDTQVSYLTEGQSDGEAMADAARLVTTPYVLVGEGLTVLNNQSGLQRLVQVLEEVPYVAVAGGAARDAAGHWRHGCEQQRWADYAAEYASGYYHSRHECMYCDDVMGPFVTRTHLLASRPAQGPAQDLPQPVFYRDWFLKLRSQGLLAVVCPDAMFFLDQHANMTRQDWLPLAKRWALQTITFQGTTHHFTCQDIEVSCKNPLGTIRKSMMLPPCCRRQMEQYLTYITDYGERNQLPHELQAGTALGAVKMGEYLPWDYDADLVFECQHYRQWLELGKHVKQYGCSISVIKANIYFTMYCPNFFLEMVCFHHNHTSNVFLPPQLRNTPTRIWYGDRWTQVSANPGLHARNRFGLNDLRHAPHWRVLKVTEEGEKKGGYDHPGVWPRCAHPLHHSCLDRFPGDGNLPFTRPFRHP